MTRTCLFGGALLILLGAGFIGLGQKTSVPLTMSDGEMSGTATRSADPREVRAFSEIISPYPEEGNIPREVYEKNYDRFGPHTMLAALDLRQFCHAEAHNLGRVIYAHTKDLPGATLTCQSSCSAGCIHGALMGWIETQTSHAPANDPSAHDLSPALTEELADMCESDTVSRYTGYGNCFHSLGHALMALTDYDIAATVALCDIFASHGRGAVYYCATGVYMEEDIQLGVTDGAEQSLYPCDESPYPAACYRYKLRRIFSLPREYGDAKALCESLPQGRAGCFHGLGFGAYRMVYDDPASLNELCVSANRTETQLCVEGAVGLIALMDSKKISSICETYADKELCRAAAEISNFGMKRDFSLYEK